MSKKPLVTTRALKPRFYPNRKGLLVLLIVLILIVSPLVLFMAKEQIINKFFGPTIIRNEFKNINLPSSFQLLNTDDRYPDFCPYGGCTQVVNTYRIAISEDKAAQIVLHSFEERGYKLSADISGHGTTEAFGFYYHPRSNNIVEITRNMY